MIQVISFTHTLSHSCKHRVASVLGSNVTNELLDDHGLSHSCSTKESYLSSLQKGHHEVNGFDTCLKHFCLTCLLIKAGWLSVNWKTRCITSYFLFSINRLTKHVKKSSKCSLSHRNGDRGTSSRNTLSTRKTCGVCHRNGTNSIKTNM